jgi:raffinose/stachyose/melibiose transport system substrate-binding protein
MKSRKWFSLITIVVFALLFAACGPSAPAEEVPAAEAPEAEAPEVEAPEVEEPEVEEAPSDVVEIEIFTRFADGASKTFFDEVAASFMEENPNIVVNVTSADNETYKAEIGVRLASESAPDIYFAWSGVYAKNFYDGGKALDLTSYIESDTDWSSKIIASQFGPYTYDGGIYGIPIIMDGKAFYYNVEIFDELNLSAPENWDEFMKVLDVLAESEYIPISLGNIDDWATGHYMTTLNQRVVPADVLAADYALESDAPFSDPTYVEALNYLNQLVPYFTPEFNSVTYDQGINDFTSGKAAIYYEQFNQNQYIQPADFEWYWFDFPDIEGAAGDQDALTGAPQGFMVSSTTAHPDEAVAFLKYLTSVDIAAKMVKDASMISTVDGAINSDNASEELIEMVDTVKAASSINLWIDTAMDSEVVAVYLQGVQAMVGGAMTPEEVMAAVQEKALEVKGQ